MLLVLAILGSGAEPATYETRCDWIEVNHLVSYAWDQDAKKLVGSVTLSQVIFWDGAGRDRCVAWRTEKNVRFISEGQGVSVVFHDGERLIRVRAKFLIETAELYDPELADRSKLPPERRRGLGCQGEMLYPSLRLMRHKEQLER